jgi:hypothetical protein
MARLTPEKTAQTIAIGLTYLVTGGLFLWFGRTSSEMPTFDPRKIPSNTPFSPIILTHTRTPDAPIAISLPGEQSYMVTPTATLEPTLSIQSSGNKSSYYRERLINFRP